MRFWLLLFSLMVLISCSYQKSNDSENEYLAEELREFVDVDVLMDTIEMVDSYGMKDIFIQKREINAKAETMNYRVSGNWFYLDMKISVRPSENGGNVEWTTSYETMYVYYNTSKSFAFDDGNLVYNEECKLGWIKSMYLDDAKYNDVLIFSPACTGGEYKFDKLYYAADEGLIRVDINDSVSLFRVLKKE